MRRVYKYLCPATISASVMAANVWKNSLKNVESDNNKILYGILLIFLQRNGTYFLNKPRIMIFLSYVFYWIRQISSWSASFSSAPYSGDH